jgi:hypothetical protein
MDVYSKSVLQITNILGLLPFVLEMKQFILKIQVFLKPTFSVVSVQWKHQNQAWKVAIAIGRRACPRQFQTNMKSCSL